MRGSHGECQEQAGGGSILLRNAPFYGPFRPLICVMHFSWAYAIAGTNPRMEWFKWP